MFLQSRQALTSAESSEANSPLLKVEASAMLLQKANMLPEGASEAGEVPWPDCLTASFPRDVPDVAAANCIAALAVVVTSRPKAWWYQEGKTWTWAVHSLIEALEVGTLAVRGMAAPVALELLSGMRDDEYVVGLVKSMSKSEAAKIASSQLSRGSFTTELLLNDIRVWNRDNDAVGSA